MSNINNNNNAIGKEKPNLVKTPNPPTPPTKVISKTASKTEKEKEKEMISIPKEEYDSLNNRITYLTGLIRQTKGQMINMQDALTMVQKIVLDSKQTMKL
ncbi:MAG: hypothetical protein R2685_07900 [Candidatus Nitrosocosmicus sp.]|jgi:hypothetical protein|nr:hypothetical protein [Candidatus Nitrosocosmicus sp.]